MNEIIKQNTFLQKTVKILFRKKMEEVCLIDLQSIPNLLVDFLLIGTSHSEVQMNSALGEVKKMFRKNGLKKVRFEHTSGSRWGVLDSEEVVIHLFEAETRKFYSLEQLWDKGVLYKLIPEKVIMEKHIDDEQFI